MVVADKPSLDYHNNTNMETYILTIMNMVADLFHDASVGNLMDIVVVRIIYLNKQEEKWAYTSIKTQPRRSTVSANGR